MVSDAVPHPRTVLVQLLDAVAQTEVELADAKVAELIKKEELELAESQALLGGKITGKNADYRAAELMEVDPDTRQAYIDAKARRLKLEGKVKSLTAKAAARAVEVGQRVLLTLGNQSELH